MPGWEPRDEFNRAVLADLTDRLNQHQVDDTLPRSARGLFYDLRPSGYDRGVRYVKHPPMWCVRGGHLIDPKIGRCTEGHGGQQRRANPMDTGPDQVREILAKARRAGLVPEGWIEDTRAPSPSGAGPYDDPAESAADLAASYVRRIRNPSLEYDPQTGQPVYLEVLCEAEGLIGGCPGWPSRTGCRCTPYGGYDGLKGKRAFAERAGRREVPTVVLRITDWDKHGRRIDQAGTEDSLAWAR